MAEFKFEISAGDQAYLDHLCGAAFSVNAEGERVCERRWMNDGLNSHLPYFGKVEARTFAPCESRLTDEWINADGVSVEESEDEEGNVSESLDFSAQEEKRAAIEEEGRKFVCPVAKIDASEEEEPAEEGDGDDVPAGDGEESGSDVPAEGNGDDASSEGNDSPIDVEDDVELEGEPA